MWRISFWLFFSIGYIIINNSIKAGFNPYRPNRLHFLPYFNPRSPCGERPMSTLSLNSSLDFNPRSPCGERPRTWHTITPKQPFQSTLPVRGATMTRQTPPMQNTLFQSTLPVRGATLPQRAPLRHMGISIHAPRAGSDSSTISSMSVRSYFNPRSPCGERRFADGTFEFWRTISIHAPRAGSDASVQSWAASLRRFQSTLPVRGATSWEYIAT